MARNELRDCVHPCSTQVSGCFETRTKEQPGQHVQSVSWVLFRTQVLARTPCSAAWDQHEVRSVLLSLDTSMCIPNWGGLINVFSTWLAGAAQALGCCARPCICGLRLWGVLRQACRSLSTRTMLASARWSGPVARVAAFRSRLPSPCLPVWRHGGC